MTASDAADAGETDAAGEGVEAQDGPPDELPIQSDTPPEHTVIGLRIEAALLPDWYDAVCLVAQPLCRRMAVIEKPEEWAVQVELPDANLPAFKSQLGEAWEAFVARRKAEGRWDS